MPLLRVWFALCDVCAAEHHSDADRRWTAACDAYDDGWHRSHSQVEGNRWICPTCWKLGRR